MLIGFISRTIFVYNPTDQRRVQLVKVLLDTSKVFVTSNKQAVQACQIDPTWAGRKSNVMRTDRFEVCFGAQRQSLDLVNSVFSSLAPYSSWRRSLFIEGIHNPCQHQWTIVSVDHPRIFQRERTTSEHICVCAWTMRSSSLKYLDMSLDRFRSVLSTRETSSWPIDSFPSAIPKRAHFFMFIIWSITRKSLSTLRSFVIAHRLLPNVTVVRTCLYLMAKAKKFPSVLMISFGFNEAPWLVVLIFFMKCTDYSTNWPIRTVSACRRRSERTYVRLCLGSEDYAVEVGANSHLTMNQDIEIALRFTTGIKNGADFFTDLNGFQVGSCEDSDGFPEVEAVVRKVLSTEREISRNSSIPSLQLISRLIVAAFLIPTNTVSTRAILGSCLTASSMHVARQTPERERHEETHRTLLVNNEASANRFLSH